MSNSEHVKFSLKVVTNKQRTKVFYAEVDSGFADILLSFLSLPLGTIVRILGKHYGDESPVFGSLTTLSNLNSELFCTESCKQMLLYPRKSLRNERCKLKLNVDDTPLTKAFNEDVKFSLKVVTNKQRTKVLYAEIDSDFADILLSFLSLPLGTIVRIFCKHYGDDSPVIGSLTNLYNSLSNLDSDLFCTESCKQMLLNPRKSLRNERCKLKLNVDDTPLTKYLMCPDKNCITRNFGLYYDTSECDCGESALSCDMGIVEIVKLTASVDEGNGGVYTKSTASFIISDDLQIFPSETRYSIHILKDLGITDIDVTELMDATFGLNQVMDLLKGSLLSKTPLTDIILNKGLMSPITVECDKCILPVDEVVEQKMRIKAIMQESTNRLLFVEADGNFVDILFSLLTIPLGAVELFLRGSTGLKNIDNLYRSLGNITDGKYLNTKDIEFMLLKPLLPIGYVCKDNILPLFEETWSHNLSDYSFKSPKGPGNYVKGQKMYMVTDDLTATPLCMASSISIFKQLKVPLSDVKELELDIGLKEALSILKASLTSTSALTDGFMIKPTSMKKPKQEHA
ncbi:hypothetical protein CASFOL_019996 [Castilleja foliolosa]|uniref:DUF674 family protein n=1 Tax=Castilleja foliolosa TaxID=1961234 RepID=A0ABD3D2B8_9LAMI